MPDHIKEQARDALDKKLDEFQSWYEANMDELRSEFFYERHFKLFRLALHGIGILNYWNPAVSGEAHFLQTWLASKNAPVVLDVGALKGDYARLVRSACPDARVHSFEPHPVSFKELERTAAELGTVAHPFGLSDASGARVLYDRTDTDKPQHASLYKDVIERIHQSGSKSYDVRLETLDGFLTEADLDEVELLKIDAEGHELPILTGARAALERGAVKAVHFEFNEMNVYSRTFFKDIYDTLPGYTFYRMLPDGLAPLGTYRNPLQFELFAYQNIVAILE